MITDDELLLYYYRDGLDAAERARIGTALSEQPELAQRLQALVSRLDAAAAMPEVPVPRTHAAALASRAGARGTRMMARATRACRAPAVVGTSRWPAAAAAAVAVVALDLGPFRTLETAERRTTTLRRHGRCLRL